MSHYGEGDLPFGLRQPLATGHQLVPGTMDLTVEGMR